MYQPGEGLMSRKQRLQWSLTHLDRIQYLLNPKSVVPGSDMLLTSLERTIEEVEYQLAMLEMAESANQE
jgi:cytochrome c2